MKYAIVGAGGRHRMFRRAVTETHAKDNALVALCDVNQSRLALAANDTPPQPGNGLATYHAGEFDRMIAEQQPDTVIVTVRPWNTFGVRMRARIAPCGPPRAALVILEDPTSRPLRAVG